MKAIHHRFPSIAVSAVLLMLSAADASGALDDSLVAAARRVVPEAFTDAKVQRGIQVGLWNEDHSAIAVSYAQRGGSLVLLFLRRADGGYRAVDASRVEGGNFGKLGVRAESVDRFETVPVRWSQRTDGAYEVQMRTRVWKHGRRQTVAEPLVLQTDGTIFWR